MRLLPKLTLCCWRSSGEGGGITYFTMGGAVPGGFRFCAGRGLPFSRVHRCICSLWVRLRSLRSPRERFLRATR